MKYIAILALMIAACDPSIIDNGRIEISGVELYSEIPMGIRASPDIEQSALLAGSWWNYQVRDTVFYSPTPTPDITISFGYVPSVDYDPETATGDDDGIAIPEFSTYDGLIISCEIVVSSDISYDRNSVIEVLKHELGHCLGLTDDPHSLDLNSIMSDPQVWRGEVTERDRALILERSQEW